MITDTFNDKTLSAILFVATHPLSFIVCGSRFFGDAKKTSDFDFVTGEFSLYQSLKDTGWEDSESDKGGYVDSNTEHVVNKGQVQIIFAKSVERRIKAREWIKEVGKDRHKTESWEKAYEAIDQ